MDLFNDILNMASEQHQKKQKLLQDQTQKKISEQKQKEENIIRKATEVINKQTQQSLKGDNDFAFGTSERTMGKRVMSFDKVMAEAEKNSVNGAFVKPNSVSNTTNKATNSSWLSNSKNKLPSKIVKKKVVPKKGVIPAPSDLTKLNQKKRDLRTIEEIQADLKKKKGGEELKRSKSDFDIRRKNTVSGSDVRRKVSGSKVPSRNPPTSTQRPEKKQKNFNAIDEQYAKTNYSDIIQGMFGTRKRRYSDETDTDSDLIDMEAGADDMEWEERRSKYIGKMEDLEEEKKQKKKKDEIY